MGYRRKGKKIHVERVAWRQWLDSVHNLIADSGLPESVLIDEEAWSYFLDRGYSQAGYLGQENWFDATQLAPVQKVAVWKLIERWVADRQPVNVGSLASTWEPK
ncbi:hypothetical protein DTL21_19595 [Bremerella cremea]|uniref:Uncharacterized protein n=1 Tax=Blastopirellula marina TaxID=124 RepID=A0A2S8FJS9_9BACT|nr:hypothetical protein C5Y83_19575 [Blastopirellula marina]RCS45489.1 hypothetical protein DTL21_19595 [Bremerella cremea]